MLRVVLPHYSDNSALEKSHRETKMYFSFLQLQPCMNNTKSKSYMSMVVCSSKKKGLICNFHETRFLSSSTLLSLINHVWYRSMILRLSLCFNASLPLENSNKKSRKPLMCVYKQHKNMEYVNHMKNFAVGGCSYGYIYVWVCSKRDSIHAMFLRSGMKRCMYAHEQCWTAVAWLVILHHAAHHVFLESFDLQIFAQSAKLSWVYYSTAWSASVPYRFIQLDEKYFEYTYSMTMQMYLISAPPAHKGRVHDIR
jgi:hypothetical protein